MSHNSNDPGRSARRHRPAIIAIVIALVVAIGAYFFFPAGIDEQNEGIATTPPVDAPVTDAEGLEEGRPTPVAPEGTPTPEDAVEGEPAAPNN